MAINPMQRKARNSFLLGMGSTMLIAVLIIAFLIMQMSKLNKQIKAESDAQTVVSVLTQDVNSGQKLDASMFTSKKVNRNTIPSEIVNFATLEAEYVAKIDLKSNTVLTAGMITKEDEQTTDDLREQTYNMIVLPIDLNTGDYVDIRLALPNGQDYIVLSKLKVTIPDESGVPFADTIKVNISEGDLLTLSSAIVESYQIEGSMLYAIKYVEAGNQKAATANYVPTAAVVRQITTNPNIVAEAMNSIRNRWTTNAQDFRNKDINNQEKDTDAAKTKTQENAQKTKQARENYLSTLYGSVASN